MLCRSRPRESLRTVVPVQVLDHELGALAVGGRASGGYGVVLRRVVPQRLTLTLPTNVPLLVLVLDLACHSHGGTLSVGARTPP